jgi:hypothetical protein
MGLVALGAGEGVLLVVSPSFDRPVDATRLPFAGQALFGMTFHAESGEFVVIFADPVIGPKGISVHIVFHPGTRHRLTRRTAAADAEIGIGLAIGKAEIPLFPGNAAIGASVAFDCTLFLPGSRGAVLAIG